MRGEQNPQDDEEGEPKIPAVQQVTASKQQFGKEEELQEGHVY